VGAAAAGSQWEGCGQRCIRRRGGRSSGRQPVGRVWAALSSAQLKSMHVTEAVWASPQTAFLSFACVSPAILYVPQDQCIQKLYIQKLLNRSHGSRSMHAASSHTHPAAHARPACVCCSPLPSCQCLSGSWASQLSSLQSLQWLTATSRPWSQPARCARLHCLRRSASSWRSWAGAWAATVLTSR
jgi:hypothetical protein